LMLVSTPHVWDSLSSLSRRMVAMGIIAEMKAAIEQLETINQRLELEISVEDADIDFGLWGAGSFTQRIQPLFQGNSYIESEEDNSMVNAMCDLFTISKSVTFSEATASSVKTGMRQLVSEGVVNHADIGKALMAGYGEIAVLLQQIKDKMTDIPDELYENYCDQCFARDLDLAYQQAERDYRLWKDEHEWKSLQALEDKRTQEIVKLLAANVFVHATKPTNREIKDCRLKIQEEALELDTQLPDNIDTECARLARYVVMKGSIMWLDYAKLGKYLYKHYHEITFEDELRLKVFSVMLDFIHRDMADVKPSLAVYLPDYEDNKLQAIFDNAAKVFNSCKSYLNDGLSEDFLTDYLKAIFYGDIKKEVQKRLGRKSPYSTICEMIGMLKSSLKVFKANATSERLAACISPLTEKPNKDSMKRKIDKGADDHTSKIRNWTDQYIREHCYSETERLFLEQARK